MSNILLDPCNIDTLQLIDAVWSGCGYQHPVYSTLDDSLFINNTLDDANIILRQIHNQALVVNSFQNQLWDKVASKYTRSGNRRVCLVRVPVRLLDHTRQSYNTGYEILHYLPVSNVSDIYRDFVYVPNGRVSGGCRRISDSVSQANYNASTYTSAYGSTSFMSFDNTNIDAFNNYNKVVNDTVNIPLLKSICAGKTYYFGYSTDGEDRYSRGLNIIPSYMYGGCYSYEKLPDTIPVFDVEQVDEIRAFLDSGDDSGKKDPFDPNNPAVVTVTDYKTDFTLYLTKGTNATTHFSLTATNTQFSQARDILSNDYCMLIGVGTGTLSKMRTPYGQQTLTKSWNGDVNSTGGAVDYAVVMCFGDNTDPSEWGETKPEHTSGYFTVGLKKKASSECGCSVVSVSFKPSVSGSPSLVSRTAITDGYLYTASTGEKLKVLFRGITTDDLKDINDDGYDNESDTEDASTGTTAQEVCGHGLGTYKISQVGFDAINDALWSTDWSQLFKSNTIDPVKCVISCKGIPFSHSGTATDAVYIANQRVVCSAGKCNPVNTYNIGSYTIQAINNNFTDMTMTKVRAYLPYVGWVELPAEEVISRVGRAEVGLSSVTKLLNFKYIVDFVDGSCRCVISVNGTERWFFDGSCGVDIPVTSDNHTSAINNAIKSGVATVMNVGLAVASAYSGNAMGVASGVTGAISSMANTIPTYSYSATANSSGYINHSMGNKIVIVIESPNVQMPNGYGHKYGFPCMRNLTLGSLSGYTKCESVDLTGINGTNYELNYIKSALESGVYL